MSIFPNRNAFARVTQGIVQRQSGKQGNVERAPGACKRGQGGSRKRSGRVRLRGRAYAMSLAVACVALFATAATAVAAPTVTIDPSPTGLYNSAQVSGKIDPGQYDTYFTF